MSIRRPYLRLVEMSQITRAHHGERMGSMIEGRSDTTAMAKLQACLCAVAEGQDRDAFRILFDHFAPRIKAYGVRLGCTTQQSEELAQETMVKVWRKAAQFDRKKANPSTWIFRIARNQRIDMFRREHHPEFDPNDPCLIPQEEQPVDQVMEQMQSEALMRTALDALPQEQKLLLHMSFYQDLSHSQIAEHLGLPLGTVKSRVRLAIGKLRSKLGDRKVANVSEEQDQ